jgi:hypothetical protein
LYKAYYTIDPDFGWRLVAGKLYLSSGIPLTDPFSYTMSSFPWVDHAWSVSTLIGAAFPIIGKLGLSIIFSFLAVVSLLLSFSQGENIKGLTMYFRKIYSLGSINASLIASISFLLAVAIVLPFAGVRAQIFTWFLFSLLLKFILSEKLWIKYRKYLPLYFLLWVNIHGGFMLGLVVTSIVIFTRVVEKKVDKKDVFVLVSSFAVTLINPYKLDLWREVLSSVTDSALRWSVAEWMPSLFRMDLALAFFIPLTVMFVTKYRKKFALAQLITFYFLFIQAILSLRNIPLWIFTAMPLLACSLNYFYLDIKKNKSAESRFVFVYQVAWIIALFAFILQTSLVIKGAKYLIEGVFYPNEAVSYLVENPPKGEIFSFYGWGGYLIWKFPEKKVFIDGRMPSWEWYQGGANQENRAFETYMEILSGDANYQEVFEKYGIETIFWPRVRPENKNVVEKKLTEVLENLKPGDNNFNFIEKLQNDGWSLQYEDPVSAIYIKK